MTDHNSLRIQEGLRKLMEKVRPRSLKPIQETGTGVDYTFAGKKIDFKFCFGIFGENSITVRIQNGKLVNGSDWTMICNQIGDIILVRTQKIREYVDRNPKLMKENFILKKERYSIHKITLPSLFGGEIEFTGNIRSRKALLVALTRFNQREKYASKSTNPFEYPSEQVKKRIVDLVKSWKPKESARIEKNRGGRKSI